MPPRSLPVPSPTPPQSPPALGDAVNGWLAHRGPGRTNGTYADCLGRVLALVPLHYLPELSEDEAVTVAHQLAARYAPCTAMLTIRAMSSLWSHLIKAGLAEVNPWAHGAGLREPPRTLDRRILSLEQVRSIVAAAPDSESRQLLRFLFSTGLRVSEAVSVTWGDVREDTDGRILCTVVGKGGKARTVEVPPEIWASVRFVRPPGAPEERIWRWETHRGARYAVKRAARAAGLPRVSPHWFRHAYAAEALRGGAPLPSVSAALGHARLETTATYLQAVAADSPRKFLPKI
jgi:site-specific recombinase XerD